MKVQVRAVAASIALLFLGHAPADAQPERYPERPVRVVVAFAPGGNNDVPVRIVTTKLGEIWGIAVNVDNRAGAGGIIGSSFAARAAADGYTLLNCNSATHGVNPALHRKLPYHPVKDFSTVSLIGSAPNVLLVPASSSITTVQEFIGYVKSNPGKMAVATAGIGSTQHFSLELLKAMAGADIVHVPYKGGSLALADLIGDQVPSAITGLPTALSAIKAGKVRALAVTSANRSQHVPALPTLSEAGLPGYEVTTWTGLCAPAGTPQPILERLNADVRRAVESSDTRRQLSDAGVEPSHSSAERLSTLITSEVERFSRIAATAGIATD